MTSPAAVPPPDTIYVIRHGEKPADPPAAAPGQAADAALAAAAAQGPPYGVDGQGNQDPHSLLPRGWQRSGALAVLFDPATGPAQAGLKTPGALLSPSYGSAAKTAEHRTCQTIQGLADRLGLAIVSDFAEGSEAQLAASVVSSYSGVVLICWEHDHIPAIATALPTAPGTVIPQPWPGDRFDVIWTFTLVPGTTPAQYTFGQIPQQLLSGDTDTIITA
jgi:hypothetical protein